MRAKSTKQAVIRKIAADAADKVFDNLTDAEADLLATSVLRQWISNGGDAVLTNGNANFYLHLREDQGGYSLGVEKVDGGSLAGFYRDWNINADTLPEVLHSLNIRQSADVISQNGLSLRFSINAMTRTTSIEDLTIRSPK